MFSAQSSPSGPGLSFHTTVDTITDAVSSIVIVADAAVDANPSRATNLFPALLSKNTAIAPDHAAKAAAAIFKTKSAQQDHTVVFETTVLPNGEDLSNTLRVCVGLLPLACSRHNTPSKSHGVTDVLKKARVEKRGAVILCLLRNAEDAVAVACAVAKVFPLYSRKTSNATSTESHGMVNVVLVSETPISADVLNKASLAAKGVRFACAMIDAPCNEFNSDTFVGEAKAVKERLCAAGHNVNILVIQGKDLEEQGFGGIYGVGKAANNPPALVCLSYLPKHCTQPHTQPPPGIVWVGKGIVYDTGGLSIKDKLSMPSMKTDMGGAAAVCAAFEAAVLANAATKPLHAVLCIAENSVGRLATRPDDIHVMYSKKTVEINNTDAEGRLVLADGVAFAVDRLNPIWILDMATLTGAQGIATGKRHAAIYASNEHFENICVQAGRASGDLTHPLPFAPEFFREEFASQVADMKNSVNNRSNAQSSCAAQFIANHIESFVNETSTVSQDENSKPTKGWIHVDMASPGRSGERATGYGVALLLELLARV